MENLSSYSEYLTARKAGFKTFLLRTFLLVGFFAVIFCSIVAVLVVDVMKGFFMAFPVLWVLVAVLVWFLWGFTTVEYEYTIVSGYFQLDVIHSKKNRKRLCEGKISEMHFICPVTEKNAAMRDSAKYARVIKACSSMKAPNLYCLAYKDAKDGETLVYFDAIKKTLDSFAYYNRKAVDRGDL